MNTRQFFIAVLLAAFLTLAGCGGGSNSDDNAVDVTPGAFTLPGVENAEPGTYYTASMTVAGVNQSVKVRVCCAGSTAGTFSIDGGETWLTEPADVENGDEVMIRLESSEDAGGIMSASLYVGGTTGSLDAEGTVSADFQVVTKSDLAKPELVVHFPPPVSLIDTPLPGVLVVRGAVTDDDPATTVSVNGEPADIDPDTGNWRYTYSLVDGIQTLDIIAQDTAGNTAETNVTVQREASLDAVEFGGGNSFTNPAGVVWDPVVEDIVYTDNSSVSSFTLADGMRTRIHRSPPGSSDSFSSEDIVRHPGTGQFFLASDNHTLGLFRLGREPVAVAPVSVKGDGNGPDIDFNFVDSVTLDAVNDVAYILSKRDADFLRYLWKVDLETGVRTLLSNPADALGQGSVVRFDPIAGRVLVADCDLKAIDPATGVVTTVVPEAADFCAKHVAVDTESGEKLVYRGQGILVLVDLAADSIEPIPGGGDPAFGTVLSIASGLDVDWDRRVAYQMTDGGVTYGNRLTAVDIVTGYRVVMARN